MRSGLLWLVPIALGIAAVASAQDSREWVLPRFDAERLDWCWGIARDCGAPVAAEFCKRKRYDSASAFSPQRVGRSAATRTMGTNQTCSDDEGCTGFAAITCTGKVAPERIHNNPSFNQRRLDVCMRSGSTECGQPVADAYCRLKRFSSASHFRPDEERGNAPTGLLSGQTCERTCRGFQQIICQ